MRDLTLITRYTSTDEIQRDLDQFIEYYNIKRTHQGYRLKGRTPAQALREALGCDELPPIVPVATDIEEVNDAETVTA
jgi:hypothetical protein